MLKIGHRGASGSSPENTLTAFREALAQGADGVELDIHRCKTGELVVMHDDTVDRTTNGNGRVAEMTYAQLLGLRIAGSEHIPLLHEVLGALKDAYCFIEIKYADAALGVAQQIDEYTKHGWPADRLWLISFDHGALKVAHAAYPELNIGASFEKFELPSIEQVYALGARAVIIHYQSVGPEQVQQAHALGLKIICWTVNDPTDIARLQTIGVDGIMSDYPEKLRV